ncbi:MAG: type II CRISPR RNA-guided endonuclease Cas9 [Candidatus Izemoplasma sp.]|nr:type II CRISPR RNA-guided endonuclease Cas9 [Candidatus Izemoplasma sp.]
MSNGLILGFDLGITSVGWGIINHEKEVVDCGVRLFDEADKDLNAKRREKRGSRRVKRRRKQRIVEMKRLLKRENIIDDNFVHLDNPYHIRVKGLNEKLNNRELATALLHIVKRRGSSLDIVITDDSDDEAKKMKGVLQNNTKQLDKADKYVCEVQLDRLLNHQKVRGETNNFRTEDYIKETKAILKNQTLSESAKDKIIELIKRKRHYSDGPGSKTSPTPYGRYRKDDEGKIYKVNLIEEMRGKCSIYDDELRAPSSAFSALKFNLLNELNNLSFINEDFEWTEEKKMKVIDVIKEKGYLSPKSNPAKALAKFFDLDERNITGFRTNKSNKPIMTDFSDYNRLAKLCKKLDSDLYLNETVVDRIAEILTSHKTESERLEKLAEFIDNETLYKAIATLPGYTQYHRLSFKAIYLLNKEMMTTLQNQMQLIESLNLKKDQGKTSLDIDETQPMSPVVKRVQREAIKVLKALQKKYGNFDKVVIETTRDRNSAEQRRRIQKTQKYFEDLRNKAKEILGEYSSDRMSNRMVQKVMLYEEQNGKCAYTGNALSLKAIANQTDDYEIDHIIPYSISLDNSQNNKVLVEGKVNQLKGNKTPFEYFTRGLAYGKITTFTEFKKHINGNSNYKGKKRKRELLLFAQDVNKFDVKEEFLARNLVDTSYSVRQFMTSLRNYYKSNNIDTKVFTVKGKHTSLFRSRAAYEYGKQLLKDMDNPLHKDRDYYRHHAIDALIVAMLSEQKLLKQLIIDERNQEMDEETGELYYKNPILDYSFVERLATLGDITDDDINFAWKVDKKVNRAFSNETIYSTRVHQDEEYVVQKYNIYEMKAKDIERRLIKEKERCLVYKHDRKTYDKLIKAYKQYQTEKEPFLAFQENQGKKITKYAKQNNGPEITFVKCLTKKLGNHLDISSNYKTDKKVVLQKISAYRLDLYQEPNGDYKFVTIRYYDLKPFRKGFKVSEEVYQEKLKEKEISKEARFLFSLHKNEIIKWLQKNARPKYYKFNGINNDSNNIIELKYINHISSKRLLKTISKNIQKIEKYAVSPIGQYRKINNEILKLRV